MPANPGSFADSWLEQATQSAERAERFKIKEEIERLGGNKPERRIAGEREKENRRKVLAARLEDPALAELGLERLLGGNDLTDVNYLALGAVRARSVGRVVIRLGQQLAGYGSGFLVAPGVVMTNHHVISDVAFARSSTVQFRYERGLDGAPLEPVEFSMLPEPAPILNKALDFALVALSSASGDGQSVDQFGYLPLNPQPGKAFVGEYLTIIQHPRGERKQVCVRENKLLRMVEGSPFIWYQTDTEGGSSGSPVFNNSWDVVALHHSGVPARDKNGQYLTKPDKKGKSGVWTRGMSEDQIHWIANEGIRISAIIKFLRENHAGHPLARAVLNVAQPPTPESASAGFASDAGGWDGGIIRRTGADGSLRVIIPIEVGVRVGPDDRKPGARAAAWPADSIGDTNGHGGGGGGVSPVLIEKVEIKDDYERRNGYQPNFLGKKLAIPLPKLPSRAKAQVLKYWNYTVALNTSRRLAFYSAANIDPTRWQGNRDAQGDTWYPDKRVKPVEAQVGREFYKKQKEFEATDRTLNPFDQGHLSRRSDLQWGDDDAEAKRNGDDSYHYPNCVPQHWQFNQNNKRSGLWFRLEEHAASEKFAGGAKFTVINGPVFDAPKSLPGPGGKPRLNPEGKSVKDKAFGGVAIPKQYFKVMACAAGGKLRVAAFVVTQEDLLEKLGRMHAQESDKDVGLTDGEAALYRVSIPTLEKLTGMDFGPLGARGVVTTESAELDLSKPIQITSAEDLIF